MRLHGTCYICPMVRPRSALLVRRPGHALPLRRSLQAPLHVCWPMHCNVCVCVCLSPVTPYVNQQAPLGKRSANQTKRPSRAIACGCRRDRAPVFKPNHSSRVVRCDCRCAPSVVLGLCRQKGSPLTGLVQVRHVGLSLPCRLVICRFVCSVVAYAQPGGSPEHCAATRLGSAGHRLGMVCHARCGRVPPSIAPGIMFVPVSSSNLCGTHALCGAAAAPSGCFVARAPPGKSFSVAGLWRLHLARCGCCGQLAAACPSGEFATPSVFSSEALRGQALLCVLAHWSLASCLFALDGHLGMCARSAASC